MSHAIVIYGLWIIVSAAVIIFKKTPAFETLLRFYLGAGGISSCMAFMGHAFKADEIAKYIGWPAGNPFQFEIAIANLAFGVLGIMCLWFKDKFWLAVITGSAVFGWGVAIGHIYQIRAFNNLAPGNAGAILYMDIIMPLVAILFYIGYKSKRSHEPR